jgi:hypothetical protein
LNVSEKTLEGLPAFPKLPELSYLGDDVSYGYDGEDMRDYATAYAESARAPLLARIEELELDAARYRWLRDNADVVFNETQYFLTRSGTWIYSKYPTKHELDSAIDAALSSTEGKPA